MADEGYFGERVAGVYDEHSAGVFDPDVVGPAVDMLAELAGDGVALEFAVGTGRIALPLAERGVRVVGIDNSEAMLARLYYVYDVVTQRLNGQHYYFEAARSRRVPRSCATRGPPSST